VAFVRRVNKLFDVLNSKCPRDGLTLDSADYEVVTPLWRTYGLLFAILSIIC